MIHKNTKINYTITGRGDKYVLFLHGWGGSIDSFVCMQNVLENNFKCINIDLPPFGKSQPPPTPWSVQDYAVMVIEILNKHNIKKVDIICHSFGARVAIYIASLTTLVDKLVITGGAGIKPKRHIKKSLKIFRYKLTKTLVRLKLLKSTYLDKFGSSDYKILSPTMKQTFKNIVNFDQTAMLKHIKCATLLFWGVDDDQTPLYMAKIMQKNIPDCALLEYSGGHFVYLEQFAIFSTVVQQFLVER